MSDIQTSLGVKSELKAINVIQSEDWLKLAVFVDHAITFNATNDTQLRVQTHMKPSDAIPADVMTTLGTYQRLDVACQKWMNSTYPGSSELARDIIRHKDDCEVTYGAMERVIMRAEPNCRTIEDAQAALMRDLQSKSPSAGAKQALTDLARYVGRLWSEAGERQKKAIAFDEEIEHFHKELGECDKAFAQQTGQFEKAYGNESEEIKRLKGEVDSINRELSALRKKESDEIIALETAPLYLLIPFPFGAIIMAGVLAGVGADLDRVRKKIAGLLPKLQKASDDLARDQAYLQYHQWGVKSTQDAYKAGEDARVRVGRIKTAWQGITSDLKYLHENLLKAAKDDTLAADLDFTKQDLQKAQLQWNRLAGEAAGYLQFQLIPAKPAKTVEEAMQGVTLAKAA